MIANEQLIRNILNEAGFVPADDVVHGWIVTIDDRIFKPRVGKFIYNSRQQAVKALYNISWVVSRHYSYFLDNSTSIPHPTYQNSGNYWERRKMAWKDFKEYLGDRLKIIEI